MTLAIKEAGDWPSCGVVARQSADGSFFWAVVTPARTPSNYTTAMPDQERFVSAGEAWVAGYLFMRKRLRARG